MATDLRAIPRTEVTQTRFAGGKQRGVCIQLTGIEDNTFQHLQFTREQAPMVAQELLLFANGMEVTEEDNVIMDNLWPKPTDS